MAFPTIFMIGNISSRLNSSFYGRVVKKVILTVSLSCYCSCSLGFFFFSGGALSLPFLIYRLSHSRVSSEVCFFLPQSYIFPCSFPSEPPSLSERFLGNLITALNFGITWELLLRAFHYYFITQCQASQLQTQMKRSFSFIFESPRTRQL